MTTESTEPTTQPTATIMGEVTTAPKETKAPAVFETDDSWKSSLPKDLQEDPTIKITKSVSDLAKGYVHAMKKIGEKGMLKPSEHATEEDWQKVYDYLGREPLDKYEVKAKGEGIDQEFLKSFKEAAHKAGLRTAQAQKLVDFYEAAFENTERMRNEADQKSIAETTNAFRKEYGEAFGPRLKAGTEAVKNVLGDETANRIFNNPDLGNNPDVIRLVLKLGELASEDQEVTGETTTRPGVYTPQEAQKKIDSIFGDTKHPFHVADHPGHEGAVQEMNRLFQMLTQQ